MRKLLLGLGLVAGLYLVVRAIVEFFAIDLSDPASYRDDWGGPSLAGVLLVHCGPGVVVAVLMLWWLGRRRARRSGRPPRGAASQSG